MSDELRVDYVPNYTQLNGMSENVQSLVQVNNIIAVQL